MEHTYKVVAEAESIIASAVDMETGMRGYLLAGKEELSKYWAPSEGGKVTFHKITPEEIKVVKKTAYDFGYYEGTTTTTEGEKVNWKGKYVIVWKKIGKEWKIYLDCWNRVREE